MSPRDTFARSHRSDTVANAILVRALAGKGCSADAIAREIGIGRLEVVRIAGREQIALGKVQDAIAQPTRIDQHAQGAGRVQGFGANDKRAQDAADYGGYVPVLGTDKMAWKPGRYRMPFTVAPDYEPPTRTVAFTLIPLASLGEIDGPAHVSVVAGPRRVSPSWGGGKGARVRA